MGCHTKDVSPGRVPLNAFFMYLDGAYWEPVLSDTDPCYGTYHCSMNGRGYYGITAHRDPNGIRNASSQDYLRMELINVDKPGLYPLEGTYRTQFTSFLTFSRGRLSEGPRVRYVNRPDRHPFVVEIERLLPIKYLSYPGIEGTFRGFAYNESDDADSLFIDGRFTFGMVGGNDHCGYPPD